MGYNYKRDGILMLKCGCGLKQLCGTFHFVLILAVPVDKGGSVSPNIRVTCSFCFTLRCKETTSSGRRVAAPETDFS